MSSGDNNPTKYVRTAAAVGVKAYLPQIPNFGGGCKEAHLFVEKYGICRRISFEESIEGIWEPKYDEDNEVWYWECVDLAGPQGRALPADKDTKSPTKKVTKRTHYTPETFKQTFKVGDVIESWSTCKRLRITAIGESRFLGKDYKGDERVCTMAFTQGWTKVDEVTPPNVGW